MISRSLFFFLLLCIFNPAISQTIPAFDLPAPAALPKDSLSLWATRYYVYPAKSKGSIPLLNAKGATLGYTLDTCDFCMASIEGTIAFIDSLGHMVVLNYAGRSSKEQVDCRRCAMAGNKVKGNILWAVTDGYGDGVKGYKLIPYRTLAVDPAMIPYGTVLYIPQAKGVKIILADGTQLIHDGYFFAGDTGGAIKENHVDVFTGTVLTNPFPSFLRSDSTKTFIAYIINDAVIVAKLEAMHKKQ